MSTDNLNLVYVNKTFKESLLEGGDVHISKYIDGYTEIMKFLNLIGSVFSFVSSDVSSKMKIMEKHMKGDDASYYESFRKMMKFEKDTGLHEKVDFTSGSRTLLRLHRGLDFIRLFLRKLGEGDDQTNTCLLCQNSYADSLAQFHPWYIKYAANLAMHALPNRQDLLKKIFGNEERLQDALNILPETLETCNEVYVRVELLYTDFDFHGLP